MEERPAGGQVHDRDAQDTVEIAVLLREDRLELLEEDVLRRGRRRVGKSRQDGGEDEGGQRSPITMLSSESKGRAPWARTRLW